MGKGLEERRLSDMAIQEAVWKATKKERLTFTLRIVMALWKVWGCAKSLSVFPDVSKCWDHALSDALYRRRG
jgi:hypothetical protein